MISAPAPKATGKKDPSPGSRSGKGRIMFVDDEPELLKIAAEYFSEWGYQVETFAEPQTAWEEFARRPDRYDLVVTDVRMPRMTGAQLAERLLAKRPELPIILYTGYSIDDQPESRKPCFRRVLQKPLLPSELMAAIREILEP